MPEQITCPKCGYQFKPRVPQPKRCPNPKCGHYFVEYPSPQK